ncbi:putative polysaccharide biosynthesis protein [Papillibacter cinnamivorans]|uniref:Stage V sporulation protein B n=1 Tax=Papillibacter cinnamivorans DSM 12816 TaxID=1122930 RepID=A0A1W2A253_9FIRM|nr:polysaccharide biosynthesis protein [Papillibacter cinnamivorans]SMC54683.1 stage V sporulation protein B [Papillibacter cinnamivorans DSM 12816]
MSKTKGQTFLGGAAILAASVVIVKLLGALYKIPLGNLLDSQGMAHFYVAYNIYNLLLTICTAGLPIALSKMVSEANALGKHNQVKRIFSVSLTTFFIIGAAATLVMFFFSGPLANFMNDPLASQSIHVLAPAVVCICIVSAIRGYEQGLGNMAPTAISQVLMALGKLIVGLTAAWFLVKWGYGPEISAAGATFGDTVGIVISMIFLIVLVLHTRSMRSEASSDKPQASGEIFKRIMQIGIPITIGSSAMSIITLLDATIVLGRLQSALGLSVEDATTLYGQYTFGMNLFSLPSAFMPALGASLIPFVSASLARRDTKGVSRIVTAAMRVTALLALPAGIGLSVLSGPILHLLYPAVPETAAAAAPMLRVLGIAVIFVCLMLLANSILQAHGWVNIPILTMVIGGIVKIVTNYFLVGTPSINIHGAPIGTLCCYAVIAILNLIIVARMMPGKLNYAAIFFKPVIASLLMGAAALGVYQAMAGFTGNSIATVGAIAVAGLFYLILVLVMRIITREDLKLIPKGEKIANILRLK